jgi:hypothetical protein
MLAIAGALPLVLFASSAGAGEPGGGQDSWTAEFSVDPAEWSATGRNPYFVLEPGYRLDFEGGDERLTITVLNETVIVDGVETRVVEERESKNGRLVEVSRNYFAISQRTNSVFYFGEDVDIYRDGRLDHHGGAWHAGAGGARFGLIMPGLPLLGARHYQEIAPGVAMDRAEIVSVSATIQTPAGAFARCLKVEETTPLEPDEREYKLYAPGVGLVKDGSLELVAYGNAESERD